MIRGKLWSRRKVLSFLTLTACLPAAPGCGEQPVKEAPPPPQSSNSEMLNFEKSRQAQKTNKK